MVFSETIRHELVRVVPSALCCRLSELKALYDFNGYLFGKDKHYLDFNNASPMLARKILALLKGVEPEVNTQLFFRGGRAKKKGSRCTVRVLDPLVARKLYDLLMRLPVWESDPRVLRKKCCRRSYLRGAFLSQGSITNPEKTYHFEITTGKTEIAKRVLANLHALDIDSKITERDEAFVVYLKDASQIASFLSLVGAHKAVLQLENVRVVKAIRNDTNRLVNCETANVDKTIMASILQLETIQFIDEHLGLQALDPKLRLIALLRRENPYASLKELGDLMDPPLSKSGVNYRIRKLQELERGLRGLD